MEPCFNAKERVGECTSMATIFSITLLHECMPLLGDVRAEACGGVATVRKFSSRVSPCPGCWRPFGELCRSLSTLSSRRRRPSIAIPAPLQLRMAKT